MNARRTLGEIFASRATHAGVAWRELHDEMPMDTAGTSSLNIWGRRGIAIAWLATGVLTLPALRADFLLDDFIQRLVLEGQAPELGLGPTSLYDFTGGGLHMTEWLERGYVPWFTDPGFAIRFFRPLSSLSIALDEQLFGRAPLGSHLVGAALFVAFTAVAFGFFRQILNPNRAGLAAVVFALAGGHGTNLTWVAGRHVLVGGILGVLAVALHVRRRERASAGALPVWIAPLVLLCSMLASETSLAAASIIAAYELFGTDAKPRQRALAAAPWLAAMLVYVALYSLAGFGVRKSLLYISPAFSPLAFLQAALTRGPILAGELSFAVPAGVWGAGASARPLFAVIGSAVTALVFGLAWRGAASQAERRRVRWLAVSALVGVLPMVGGVPDGRVLLLPMLASAPLVAMAIDAAFFSPAESRRKLARAGGAALVFMHLLVAPLVRLGTTELMVHVGRKQRTLAESADFSRCASGSPVFLVTGADPALCLSGGTSLRYYRPELPARHPSFAVLSLAPHDLELERPNERELVVSVDAKRRYPTLFESLFRDTPLVAGQSVRFEHFAARVLAVEDGVFMRAAFELPSNACLLTLERQKLVGRPEPVVGTKVHVAHEPGPLGL